MEFFNAKRTVLDPLVIFQGKNIRSSWWSGIALPNTCYVVTVNELMETNVFADWFHSFADKNKGRPMLLLFDGNMSHIYFFVIQQALSSNIDLLKLTSHVADILQPIDKCCFGPLK